MNTFAHTHTHIDNDLSIYSKIQLNSLFFISSKVKERKDVINLHTESLSTLRTLPP